MKTIIATIVLGLASSSVFAGGFFSLYEVLNTGAVTVASVAKTGNTNRVPYDDGYYQAGLANPNPRFTVLDNTNCVRDNLTGLIWARNANLFSGTWSNAIVFCETNTYGGLTDWRMPNINEICSLRCFRFFGTVICNIVGNGPVSANNPFTGYTNGDEYWQSTVWKSPSYYTLDTAQGFMVSRQFDSTRKVWPVRGP